jgi:hypothetical protein
MASLLPPEVFEAMRTYYRNRNWQRRKPWDKDADLRLIWEALQRNGANRFEACAGTFWIIWQGGVRTEHNMSDPEFADLAEPRFVAEIGVEKFAALGMRQLD